MEIEIGTRPEQVFQRVLRAQLVVAEVMGVPLLDLCRNTRGDSHAALARQMAMYLCHAVFAVSINAIAGAFGRDRSTVRHAIRRIDFDREADCECDRIFAWLETSLRRMGDFDV